MNSYNITKEYVITPCSCNIALDCSYIDMYLEKAEEELSLFLKWGDPGNEASTLAKVFYLQRFLTHKTLHDIHQTKS